ncbi:hypothetical protein OESDEN_00991 [Oesophagostomum dentatum]|uniref:SAM domain-containing protein n=1 Tax=Oesophagostomum dentatum TaxID=61180 RepID=A0A0B1TN96_OESDE|nr:hypothetical protein OESDEN_00991 [Oesophagostomum dentatum]
MLPDLDKATLADLGVTAVGDQLAILRSAKDASLDMGSVTPSNLRVRISGPGSNSDASSSGVTTNGNESRKGKPPPDRHEIYHIKMPDGTTARTRQILQNATIMRKHGLVARGTTGVRQGGRSVSPVDKRSAAVIRMRQEREEMSGDDPIITRLGVRGLHSDVTARTTFGKPVKRSNRTGADWREDLEDVAVRVQIPAGNGVVRRLTRTPKSGVSASVINRISRDRPTDIPRVTVKLRGGTVPKDRTGLRSRVISRKPVHARLGKVVPAGRVGSRTTVIPAGRVGSRTTKRPFVRSAYDEVDILEEEISGDDEEYSNEDMIWDEDDETYDEDVEYMEDVRPSVYNRLSR